MQYCFPVKRCPKLYVKPYLPPCLEKLTFEASNEQLLSPGSLFSCPPTTPVSKSWPSCNLLAAVPTLKELRLHRVTGSAPIWEVLQHFTSLQLLHIVRCSTLCMLPGGIQHLTSLQELELAECDALTLLPEGIGQLSALRSLGISECSALESLPQSIKHLTALQKLFVLAAVA